MTCPKCGGDDIEQTGEFDLTVIAADECQHDFVCNQCGCLFNIVYAPISTIVVGQSERVSE